MYKNEITKQSSKVKSEREVAQSCLTLGDPKDYSLPGSSLHGILQARVLEWVAIKSTLIPLATITYSLCFQGLECAQF